MKGLYNAGSTSRSFDIAASPDCVARSIDATTTTLDWLGRVTATPEGDGRLFRVQGTRVAASLVVVDLCDFVAWCARARDAAILGLVAETTISVATIAHSHDGTLVKHVGDGFLLRFADPNAAAAASVELVGALSQPLLARAGAHTGHALEIGSDLIGGDVNLAARLCDLADPGCVLLSEALASAAAPLATRPPSDRFEVSVRGLERPVPVRLVRAHRAAARPPHRQRPWGRQTIDTSTTAFGRKTREDG